MAAPVDLQLIFGRDLTTLWGAGPRYSWFVTSTFTAWSSQPRHSAFYILPLSFPSVPSMLPWLPPALPSPYSFLGASQFEDLSLIFQPCAQTQFPTQSTTMAGTEQLLNFIPTFFFTPSAPQMLNNSPISGFCLTQELETEQQKRKGKHPPTEQLWGLCFLAWLLARKGTVSRMLFWDAQDQMLQSSEISCLTGKFGAVFPRGQGRMKSGSDTFWIEKLLYRVLPQTPVLQWGLCLLPKYPLCLHLPVQIHPVRLQILIRSWHPLWRGFIGLD